ncbi:MAG: DUF2333 family protein, partial [Deltaproteobacteria bacterium]|nr:DUF2333 family protein [Deltaproteobacteria bacterium]
MEDLENKENEDSGATGFRSFAAKRIIVGILLAVVGLWIVGMIFGFFSKPTHTNVKTDTSEHMGKVDAVHKTPDRTGKKAAAGADAHQKPVVVTETHEKAMAPEKAIEKSHIKYTAIEPMEDKVVGVTFVEALIKSIDYELNDRFYGWRPNDIFDFTDNVNSFQLGVLEVTRRTVDKLAENISRTGSTAAFDKNLENARNTCFVIEAERYWFPSAEGKYRDGLEELEAYAKKLKKGEASFFTRADSLIPLLQEYEHVLGSCDDNLVKSKEGDGSPVSFFQADEYFYYAKGVSSAMTTMLEAIGEDFNKTLERRNCLAELHNAIESCRHANHIDPIIITNSDLSGIVANHRANLAAHI